jgi:hypothetical protein
LQIFVTLATQATNEQEKAVREATAERRLEENVEGVENTVVQILNSKGNWVDYSRATQGEVLGFVRAHEGYRAVDWITKEVL